MQLQVDNLSCQHCVRAVTEAIRAHDAQATIAVDLAAKQLAIRTALPVEQVIAALADEGYPAKLLQGAD